MNPFDEQDWLGKNIDEAVPSDIPAELAWDNIASDIYIGMTAEKKSRQLVRQRRYARWLMLLLMIWIGPCIPVSYAPGVAIAFFPIPIEKHSITVTDLPPNRPNKNGSDTSQINDQISIIGIPETSDTTKVYPTIPYAPLINDQPSIQHNVTDLTMSNPPILSASEPKPSNNRLKVWSTMTILSSDHTPLDIEWTLKDSIFSSLASLPLKPDKQADKKWNLMVYGGMNQFDKGYDNSEVSYDNYETALTGFQLGARLQRRFGNRFALQTGMEWQRLRYRFNQDRQERTKLYRPETIDTIFVSFPSGDTSYVFRDSIDGTRITQIQHFNYHNAFNFPVLIGYRIGGNRLSFQLNAGVNFRYLQQSTGITATANSSYLDIANENIYRESFTVGVLTELMVTYPLSPKWSLFTNIGLEKNLANWLADDDLGFSKQPTIRNFNLGLQVSF